MVESPFCSFALVRQVQRRKAVLVSNCGIIVRGRPSLNMRFALKRDWWPIAFFLLSLLLHVDQAISDPCDALKTELSAATKARDECLARVQKADDSCEGSKVAANLREALKKKEESLSQHVKKNSALNTELMECQETASTNKEELHQHEKRKALLDKRLMETKEKLTKCEDQVAAFGPDDASAAQQDIVFLRKQVKSLQESNTEQYTMIETLRTTLNELRIRDAVCQSNYSHLEKEHAHCNMSQGAITQDYEILRTLVEYKNIFLTGIGTALVALLFVFIFYGRGHHHPPPSTQPHTEMLRRQFINDTLAITGGVPPTMGLHGGAPPNQMKFDVTFVRPQTAAHQVWFQQIEKDFAPLNVTVNPQKLTEYDPRYPPPSTSVIIMSEKPEGSKFFCVNQVKKEYFHIADNKELIDYAKKKYESDN